jgi:hypothetical protein
MPDEEAVEIRGRRYVRRGDFYEPLPETPAAPPGPPPEPPGETDRLLGAVRKVLLGEPRPASLEDACARIEAAIRSG